MKIINIAALLLLITIFSVNGQSYLRITTPGGRVLNYAEGLRVKVQLANGEKIVGNMKFEQESTKVMIDNNLFDIKEIESIKKHSRAGNVFLGVGAGFTVLSMGLVAATATADDTSAAVGYLVLGVLSSLVAIPSLIVGGGMKVFEGKHYADRSKFEIVRQ